MGAKHTFDQTQQVSLGQIGCERLIVVDQAGEVTDIGRRTGLRCFSVVVSVA